MATQRRFFWILTISIFLIFTTGCTSTHLRPIEVEIARKGTGLKKATGQKIEGFDLHVGGHTKFNGWAKITGQDSLSFWNTKIVKEPGLDSRDIEGETQNFIIISGPMFALNDIKSLDVVESNPGRTVVAIILAPVVLGVFVVGVSMIVADSGNLFEM